jgi:sorbitol-specific phosphotransferase system component IIBC
MRHKTSFTGVVATLLFLAMPSIIAFTLMAIFPFPAALVLGVAIGMCLAVGDILGINGLALAVSLWSVLSLALSLTIYRRLRQTPLNPVSIEFSR